MSAVKPISLKLLLTFHLSLVAVFCAHPGTQGNVVEGVKDFKELDCNVTKVLEQLRALDKNLTQLYREPAEDKGEDMLQQSSAYNKMSMELVALCQLNKKRVLKAAQDILDHGGPIFLDVDVDEEKIKDAFKWEQETMDNLSMMRFTIGEHWFDMWNLYKNLPDYDYDVPTDR